MKSAGQHTRRAVHSVLLSILTVAALMTAPGQEQTSRPKHLMREDSAAVNALVMYPDTIRLHIFQACEYPAAIVSIASLQKKSSDEFANLIGGYSRQEQEDLWDLTRYPSLIARLAEGGEKSEDEIRAILYDYPGEIHETALKYGRGYYDVIVRMDGIQARTDSLFDQTISDYPPEAQAALADIVQYPEIISLLNDHLSLTVRVGDRFRRNPGRVIQRADSLHDALAAQNAEDAQAWKDNLDQNPDEESELQSAAQEYATDNGYTQEDIDATPTPDEVSNYTCSPYSYWFGYPSWYPYSYWYPYPYWFDCGFYRDRSGRIVIIGTPSYYFINWYFYNPDHWRHYPHLGNGYVTYYYNGRRTTIGNTVVVHNWVRDNRNYLPADFLSNPSRRPDVIRQVGQLNVDARRQPGTQRPTPAVRDKYFQSNKTRYPLLNSGPKAKLERTTQPAVMPEVIQRPVKQPPVRISRFVEQPVQAPQERFVPTGKNPEPVRQPVKTQDQPPPPPVRTQEPERPAPDQKQQVEPPGRVSEPVRPPQPGTKEPPAPAVRTPEPVREQRPAPAPPAYNFNNINKAQEYHRNVWEQEQPRVQPQPAPAPQQQPQRQQPVSRPAPGKKK